MHWLPLALTCALALALADAATKRWLRGYTAAELVMVRFGLTALLLAPLLTVGPMPTPTPQFWLWMGASLPLEVLAEVLYVLAIRDSPLSLTLPYLAFTPVLTALAGDLLLGERLGLTGFAGVLLVVVGAYVLNLEHARLDRPATWLAPLAAIVRLRGARLMLAVAVIYGLTSVLGKGAMHSLAAPAPTFGALYFALVGTATFAVFALWQPRALVVLARPRPAHLLVAALMAAMILTHFLALALTETAYMIAVKRVSILFGIVVGAVFFAEGRLARNLFAGALMVGGVALIGAQAA
ncbi:MAG: DMT family transporter [Thiobacillaceae bacterium]|nr:DMT family transporter [Thiobacillaceae bacterium]